MYFPVGWPKCLHTDENNSKLLYVTSNLERVLFAILTEDSICLWYCKPSVQIFRYRRSDHSVYEFGINQTAVWKPNSSMVAVSTSRGYIIFYEVQLDNANKQATLFTQKEHRRVGGRTEVITVGDNLHIPSLKLCHIANVQVSGGVKSMVCLREELLVSTGHGLLQRIRWDGYVKSDMTIEIGIIPFSLDLQHSRASQMAEENVYVTAMQYSPLLAGFAVVMSNGRAAFMTADTLKFEPSEFSFVDRNLQVVGVWAQEVNCATTVAINHKYMLMAFGCANGEGVVYHLDEVTGALVVSNRLVVSSKDFPDIQTVCGAVSVLRWTPDGCALALAWEKGGFSIWSIFGTLLLHSMGVESSSSLCEDLSRNPLLHIISMEWGCEGYHLWMVSDKPKEALSSSDCQYLLPRLLQLQFVKAAVSVNPCVKNYEHLFLQGEEKLYLNPEDPSSMPRNNTNNNTTAPPMTHSSAAFLVGSKQWQVVPIPHTYLVHNWPIRFSAVNTSGHCVAVAGKTGLAHYTLFSRKWKLFGNETQEQDMMVTGGLTWWKDFICAACYNLLDQRDEIRFYPRDSKLDNTFAHVERVPSQIMLLNTFRDILIMLCADSHIMIFRLERKNIHPNPGLVIHKLQEVSIGNFIPHPATVASISLTSLRTETASMKSVPQPNEAESIMLNVAGRLLMFQRDRSSAQAKPKEGHDRPLPFCAPVVVASSVENMWSCSRKNDQCPHLTEALWLSCGAAGMKVWLPLLPREGSTRGFMSKRIMLPFHVDIYPVALLFEAGIILGASSESVCYRSMRVIEEDWPYLQLERTSQVYLHHVLRKLLRRNLGVHALEIAGSCTDMPHFHHVLELLVHEVLEEEATSKEPIPDPLLPRVMAFVQEFPEFLQTVVHCARKTEVALWQYLFATVGNPKDLFEECVKVSQLETAASYLIILQNLEKLSVAHDYATMLLDAALEKCRWELARDLVRFLRSIDPKEAESPNPGAKKLSTGSAVYPATFTTPPSSPDDVSKFKYTGPMRSRSVSMSKEDVAAGVTPKEKLRQSKTDPQPVTRCRSGSQKDDVVNSDTFFIDTILNRHARKLLSSYRIRDLAFFAANMEDYQLVSWLRIERLRAARVEDFVTALKALHSHFHWPLPILSLTSLRSVSSMASLSRSESLLDGDTDVNGASGCSPAPHSPVSNHCLGPQLGSPVSSTSTAEVMLQRRSTDDWSHATTEQSDTSSALGDLDNSDMSCADSSDILCLSVLDQLSQELANKGSPQSEVELRYLFQILLEAGCLEWALLIAIVLRDTMATVRTVNTASLTDTPIEIVGRMREGLSFLELWADTECFGYKPFLQSIQTQSKQLQSLVQENPPRSRMSLPKRLSIISVDGSLPPDPIPSPTAESCDGSDNEKRPSLEDVAPANSLDEDSAVARRYECVVS